MMANLFKSSLLAFSLTMAATIAVAQGETNTGNSTIKPPKPLFASDEILNIRIEAPMRELTRNAPKSTDPYPATISLLGDNAETLPMMLSARGKSRRNKTLCTFPPLRVRFEEKPGDESLFDGQKGIKLVTHCRTSKSYLNYYQLEFAAYKLLNVLTPVSLRVRMAEVEYVDNESGKTVATRPGFFIEDTDDAAKRNGLKEIDVDDIKIAQLDPEAAARYALFQYMIGNLDWSMHNSSTGSDCCHNTKLLGASKDATTGLIPAAYDFDYSGLVDAEYSVPPEGISVRTVRDRRYRGFCRHSDLVRLQAAAFIEKRDALYAVFDDISGLGDKHKKRSKKYLDDFFEDISSEKNLEKRLLSNCRS